MTLQPYRKPDGMLKTRLGKALLPFFLSGILGLGILAALIPGSSIRAVAALPLPPTPSSSTAETTPEKTAFLHRTGFFKENFVHAGVERTYHVFIPTLDAVPERKLPLLIVFHGYLGSGLQMMQLTDFNEIAEKEGFVVVYPNAARGKWKTRSGPSDASNEDVTFVKALIRKMKTNYPIDTTRVYATGFSNGGFLTERLACELSDQIAAFAPMSATIGLPLMKNCHPSRPVPILLINGTNDPVITWTGKIHRVSYAFRDSKIASVPATVKFWQQQNRCAPVLKSKLLVHAAHHTTGIQVNEANDCADGAEVRQIIVIKGGHTWPGAKSQAIVRKSPSTWPILKSQRIVARPLLGPTSQELDASQTIWDFFKQHTL